MRELGLSDHGLKVIRVTLLFLRSNVMLSWLDLAADNKITLSRAVQN